MQTNNIVFDASDNALEFADDAKATFGADADLQIFHDASNSIIRDSGTGKLALDGSTVESQKERWLRCYGTIRRGWCCKFIS